MTHTGQRSGITPGAQPCIVHWDSVSAAFEVTGIDVGKGSIVDEHTTSRDKIITAAGVYLSNMLFGSCDAHQLDTSALLDSFPGKPANEPGMALMIMGKIGRDAIEPVDKTRFVAESWQGLPCFEKCLLCQLASDRVIAYHVCEV